MCSWLLLSRPVSICNYQLLQEPSTSTVARAMSGDRIPQLSTGDLEQLLSREVDSFTCSMLTAPGENYGSTMLLVDVTTLPDYSKISIVAKLLPSSLHMRELFKVEETTRKEIYMYVLASPEFYTIQQENGIPGPKFLDVIPKCYGARTTRVGDIDKPVDDSSIILLDNLKLSGYRLVDRMVGMDLKHIEYVVNRLARFHATAIAIKLKKPRVFTETLLKTAFFVNNPPFPGDKGPIAIIDALGNVPLIALHKDRLKTAMERGLERRGTLHPPTPREPFATLVHDDLWTNNMMFSYDGRDGENISGLKILDFQSLTYASPAIDLIFFLFSSTDLSMTTKHCDRLIILYHQTFIDWLVLLGCDTTPFSFEKFLKELEIEGFLSFAHVLYMLRFIYLPPSEAPDLTKSSEFNRIFTDNTGFSESYFEMTNRLVKEFLERNWI